jgi:hypothetical protein
MRVRRAKVYFHRAALGSTFTVINSFLWGVAELLFRESERMGSRMPNHGLLGTSLTRRPRGRTC